MPSMVLGITLDMIDVSLGNLGTTQNLGRGEWTERLRSGKGEVLEEKFIRNALNKYIEID